MTEIDEMLINATTCLNCGKKLNSKRGYKKRHGYCCIECYKEKSPRMAFLEQIHGKGIKELIVDMLNSNNNVLATSELLGISNHAMYRWLKKLEIKRVVKWQ